MQTHSLVSFKEFLRRSSQAPIILRMVQCTHTMFINIMIILHMRLYYCFIGRKCTFCGVLINLKLRFIVRVSAWVFMLRYAFHVYSIIHIYWASLSAVLCVLCYNMLHTYVHIVCRTLSLILIHKYP